MTSLSPQLIKRTLMRSFAKSPILTQKITASTCRPRAVNELAIDQQHVRNIATWVQQIGAQEIKRTKNESTSRPARAVATWTQALGVRSSTTPGDGEERPRAVTGITVYLFTWMLRSTRSSTSAI